MKEKPLKKENDFSRPERGKLYRKPTAREQSVLKQLIKIISKALSPKRIILFGSRAKGYARKGSDFDLAVDRRRPSWEKEQELAEKVEEAAGLYNVDIVYLGKVDKDFKKVILDTGHVIYEKRA